MMSSRCSARTQRDATFLFYLARLNTHYGRPYTPKYRQYSARHVEIMCMRQETVDYFDCACSFRLQKVSKSMKDWGAALLAATE